MTQKPTISVIVLAYNEQYRLASCLDSLAQQSVLPDEIIVVDNNSTDETAAVAARYSFVRVIRETKQGIVYARDTGFDAARGDLLIRLDADCQAAPDWISTIVEAFAGDSKLMAANSNYATTELSPNGKYWGKWVFSWFRQWHQRHLGITPVLYGSTLILRRSAWSAIRKYLVRARYLSEDIDITLALMEHRQKAAIIPGAIVKMAAIRGLNLKKMLRYKRLDDEMLAHHHYRS